MISARLALISPAVQALALIHNPIPRRTPCILLTSAVQVSSLEHSRRFSNAKLDY